MLLLDKQIHNRLLKVELNRSAFLLPKFLAVISTTTFNRNMNANYYICNPT